MSNKRYDQFAAATPTGTRITLHADPSTGALAKCTLQQIIDLQSPTQDIISMLRLKGSPIIASSLFLNPTFQSGQSFASSQTMYMQLIYLPASTITGAWYILQRVAINTPSNYNGCCLYSIAGSVITLIASTTNNPALWTGSTATFRQAPFTSTVAVTAGVYYIGYLYSHSAFTQSPGFYAQVNTNFITGVSTLGMTNNILSATALAGRTSLPGSYTMTGTELTNTQPFLFGAY